MNETDSAGSQKEKGTLSAKSLLALGYPSFIFQNHTGMEGVEYDRSLT